MPLHLDAASGSQSSQVHAGLRAAILGGRLAAGLRLPSSRALASQLRVRRNAVVAAYEHLLSDGLVEARMGAGTYVAARLPQPSGVAAPAPALARPDGQGPFAVGRTSADPLLLRQLAKCVGRELARGDPALFGYGDPRGSPALRQAIAEHLRAARGILCSADSILVTSGMQQGLRLCADVLLRRGDRVWMEDPGYPGARRILEASGARLVPVPVDEAGLVVPLGRARARDARLAYVTPSHQFPMGVTMTMERRVALLDWAREAGAWVLEDDYVSEFRFAGPPLTALAGIDGHGRVIYLGTFAKTLFPGLRIGYAVLPPDLLPRVAAARAMLDRFPPGIMEGALAELMASGAYAAHLRRMRSRYRAARDVTAAGLIGASKGLLRVSVPDHGLHLVAMLPAGLQAEAAVAIRARAAVEAWLLSETRIVQQGAEGFVIGYSGHAPMALKSAAERLGRAVAAYCPAMPGAASRRRGPS